ncbi:MAG: right-handed parallel beta-helix repeat-containing protein, partial [Myxococcaceae bacterium]|nr:right-handed parallel beta-helix repeat-containing protein [Myxococcaceae bacterium]
MRGLLALLTVGATSASAQVVSTNTTWSGTVTLDRDVRVAPGVTLTVAAGTVITASTSDAANLGANTSSVELIVQGTLAVNGTAAQPVTFTSAGTTNSSWTGIRVEAGGSASLTAATLEEALYGVD